MRGLFGGFHTDPRVSDRLVDEILRLHPGMVVHRERESLLGTSASGASGALHGYGSGDWLLWDGAASVSDWFESRRGLPLGLLAGEAVGLDGPVANIALREQNEQWMVAADWTGAFPLYYWSGAAGFLFSSHLRPLARALSAGPDLPGVIQYLRRGYTINGRSLFEGIRRLVPGEQVSWRHPSEGARSKGIGIPLASGDAAGLEEQIWELLRAELRAIGSGEGRVAFMLSGGWDSRTLLAAAIDSVERDRIVCFTHGDAGSREVHLACTVARRSNARLHCEPLSDEPYDIEHLQRWFAQTESVVFPHWHHAGEVLAQLGATAAVAGVFGEVLGGRYGSAVMVEGRHKIAAVGKTLLRLDHQQPVSEAREAILHLFVPDTISKPWCLGQAAWPGEEATIATTRDDVANALQRIESRGTVWANEAIEVFVTEHRGAQYGASQLLSCRHSLDVGLPFANRMLTTIAASAPIEARIHNTLNRSILARKAPGMLSLPTAATLVSARTPMLLQEASRWMRHTLEYGQWRLHFRSRGRVPAPRYSWANFEFLRDGRALMAIVEDLRSDIWDHAEIRRRFSNIRSSPTPMHSASDMLLKVYTVDLMLRTESD